MSALGGVASSLIGGLFGGKGKSDKMKKITTQTPQQQYFQSQLLNQLQNMQGGGYGQAMNYYQDLLNPLSQAYQNFEQPYMNQFNEQILPMLEERYAGRGALSSSGFGQAVGGGMSSLLSNLAALKGGMQGQAAGGLMGQYNQLAGLGLGTPQFRYQQKEGGPSFGQTMAAGSSQYMPGIFEGVMDLFSSKSADMPQYPLTGGYDAMFRQQGLPGNYR